ncbi:MAG: hypothetical protein O3C43_06910 [Verrucomicrobia bacterium]|nr:hypothetical protein [Verrucomicrobiota bacterium]MDA1066217.1 hypothetical protein [Verrucomicrobiota bacterium]
MKNIFQYADDGIALLWQRVENATKLPIYEASVFRIVFGLSLLLINTPHYSWIGETPPTFFDPPIFSIASFFNGFPPQALFWAYDLLTPVLILCITAGVKTRWCGLICGVSYFVVSSFGYSFGKIDHSFLPWVSLLLFSFSNWGTQLALIPDKPVKNHQLPISLIALVIAFGMLSAGAEKAIRWIDFDLETSGFHTWFLRGHFTLGRDFLLANFVLKTPGILLEAGEYAAVFIEVSGILFLVLGRTSWRIWIVFVSLFHWANTLFLNIPFPAHIAVYLVFFIYPLNGAQTASGYDNPRTRSNLKKVLFLAAFLTVTHCVTRVLHSGSSMLFISDTSFTVQLKLAAILWPVLILIGISKLRSNRTKDPLS